MDNKSSREAPARSASLRLTSLAPNRHTCRPNGIMQYSRHSRVLQEAMKDEVHQVWPLQSTLCHNVPDKYSARPQQDFLQEHQADYIRFSPRAAYVLARKIGERQMIRTASLSAT